MSEETPTTNTLKPAWTRQQANEAASSVINSVDTHDAFFDAIIEKGITPMANNFNNFASALSNPQGMRLPNLLQLAKARDASINYDISFNTEQTHTAVRDVLTRAPDFLADMQDVTDQAATELDARTQGVEIAKKKDRPPYCEVGNLELLQKYLAGDAEAKQFVFDCAKELLLQGKRFCQDIWQ